MCASSVVCVCFLWSCVAQPLPRLKESERRERERGEGDREFGKERGTEGEKSGERERVKCGRDRQEERERKETRNIRESAEQNA